MHARAYLLSSQVEDCQLLTGRLLLQPSLLLQLLLLLLLLLLLVGHLRLPFLLQPQQPPLYAQHGANAATAVSCCLLSAADC
jgi:hypothetical protein